jgi:hypothetical protein
MKKLFIAVLAVFTFFALCSGSALAASADGQYNLGEWSTYKNYSYSAYSTGNTWARYQFVSGFDALNIFNKRIYSVYDTREWTTFLNTNTFDTSAFNYRPSSLQMTKPWWSPWSMPSRDANIWGRSPQQLIGTSAAGLGYGIGLGGTVSATKDGSGASGTFSVSIGQAVTYWSSTDLNTTYIPN